MNALLLAFGGVLLLAVLLSCLARRTILSTAVLFLIAGFVLGDDVLGTIRLEPGDQIIATLTELALFAVLFTDGMRVGWTDLRTAWRLPGRAVGWGLPLTLAITALLAHYVAGLGWIESLLIGAVLAPTDPVFAAALIGNEGVPSRLRHLLNVESGVNDGLALPVVVVFLAIASQNDQLHPASLALELVVGIAIGVILPWVALRLENTRWFSASTRYEPLNILAIGLLVLALGKISHGNLFLAAFAAGITVATFGGRHKESFEDLGELIAEILKLAALLVFGALISPSLLGTVGWTGWLFALLALLLARPVAIWLSFIRSDLGMREQVAVMWFGPKGFASVVYGLLVLNAAIPASVQVFNLVAVTITLSILLHSSTDTVVARWFDDEREMKSAFVPGRPRR